MDPQAITKARSRLLAAKGALDRLEGIEDYQLFTADWYVFLVSTKNVYTVLEQGAKLSPQSRQWFGGKKNERRSDPLLRYLYEARNDDEHGLALSTREVPASLMVTPWQIGPDGTYDKASFARSNGEDVIIRYGKPMRVINTPRHVQLIPVRDRSQAVYYPPQEHLGRPLDYSLPLPVARLGYTYLEKLVAEAEKLAPPA